MPQPEPDIPREMLTYSVPGGRLDLADYPWVTEVGLAAQGGSGGPAADGTPGEPGQFRYKRFRVTELPRVLKVKVIGRSSQNAEDGFVLIELYGNEEVAMGNEW